MVGRLPVFGRIRGGGSKEMYHEPKNHVLLGSRTESHWERCIKLADSRKEEQMAQTDGGWISVSQAARLYGKSRKWVSNQISAYGIETQKHGNQTRFRLTDLIAQKGEPDGNGTTPGETPGKKSQKVAPEITQETELLKQENQFLRDRIGELEADREERRRREERLQGIIDRQTLALPKPEEKGLWSRFLEAFRTG